MAAKKDAQSGQEGSRWINDRPTPEAVAMWFKINVAMAHDDLDVGDYVGGVVLIGAKEKLTVAKVAAGGSTQLVEQERYVWTPYVKVETRVKYFWDLMAAREEWTGVIEPTSLAKLEVPGVFNANLPPGFFRFPVALTDGTVAHYLGCSQRIRILKTETLEWAERLITTTLPDGTKVEEQRHYLRGIPVAEFPSATKAVPTLGRYQEDPNALMKAESGAIGRALGAANMLVIPGGGIATAEDMLEMAGAQGAGVAESAVLPEAGLPAGTDEADVRDALATEMALLQAEDQAGYTRLKAWAKERKIDLDAIKETQLRGLALQVQRIRTEE